MTALARVTMEKIVGVRYVEAGPIAYCSPGDLDLGVGDYVIVRTDRGEQLGWVVVAPDQVVSATLEAPLRVIDRIASEADVDAHRAQKRRAEEDIGRAQHAAARIDPRVRVASLAYDLAGGHADLTFTAREGSDLTERLHREIGRELALEDLRVRQVGDRDRAKSTGGIGQCGRGLCCSTWMTEFPAISIKMAKDQGLAPNPSKISGVCGRLLCCLSFEIDAYREVVGTLPKVGKRVTTPVGRAKVLSINALSEMVRLRLDDTGEVFEIAAESVRKQMGTAIRPEELQEEFEAALHAQDRTRRANLLAVLEPVDRATRDLRDAEPLERPARPERTAPAERPSRERRAPRAPAGDRPVQRTAERGRAERPARAGERPAGRPGIARRRKAGPRDEAAATTERPASRPRPEPSTGSGTTDEAAKRRRRRGRRGGRGRKRGSESTEA